MIAKSFAAEVTNNPLVLIVVGGLLAAGGGAAAQWMAAKRDARAEERAREREADAFERERWERRIAGEHEALCLVQDQLIALEAAATRLGAARSSGAPTISVDTWIAWYEFYVRAQGYAYRTGNPDVVQAVRLAQLPMLESFGGDDPTKQPFLSVEARERLDDASRLIGRCLAKADE